MPIGPSDITIVSRGANQGAQQIMLRRVAEQNVVTAILRDLHQEGLIVVKQSEYEKGRDLIDVLRKALDPEETF